MKTMAAFVWWRLRGTLGLLLGVMVTTGVAQSVREDVYTKDGKRLGYTEQRGDRKDIYNTRGERLGYGQVQADGSTEYYTPSGERTIQVRPSPVSRGSRSGR